MIKTEVWTPNNIRKQICPEGKDQIHICLKPDIYLFLLVTKKGKKTFVYRRKLNGTYRQIQLAEFVGSLDDTALKLGAMAAAVTEASRLTGKLSSDTSANAFETAVSRATKDDPTLQDLFDVYLENHIKKNGRQIDETKKGFDRWFENLKHRKASEITGKEIEKFHHHLKEKRGPYSANRAIQMGRAIFYKAKYKEDSNPFVGITLFDEVPRERYLSDTEAGKLIQYLKLEPEEHGHLRTLRDFLLLDLLTGVRKSPMLKMEWTEIDLAAGTWTIPREKAKNKTPQVIPLGPNEITVLEKRKKLLKDVAIVSKYVFPGTGASGHLANIKRAWTTLRKRLGIEDVTIHDLRRSLAASMASQNVNVALIKGAMNHKDMKTTLTVYARTNKEAELEARNKATAPWFEAADRQEQQTKQAEATKTEATDPAEQPKPDVIRQERKPRAAKSAQVIPFKKRNV